MPEQQPKSELLAIVDALQEAEQLEAAVKTMFLEGLPHAVSSGCTHPYQKQLVGLVGGVLEQTKEVAIEALSGADADLRKAEADLEEVKAAEADLVKIVDKAAAGTETAAAAVRAAELVVAKAEQEHEETRASSADFLNLRQQQQDDRSRVGRIFEEALRVLLDGSWGDEEAKASSIESVQKFLEEVQADKVLIAAVPIALGLQPHSRRAFDNMVADAVSKTLTGSISDMESKLQEAAPEERRTKAEVVGLWAIADCARDDSEAATNSLLEARGKQAEAEHNLLEGRKRTEEQGQDVAERAAKRARIGLQLEDLRGAMGAVERLSAGDAVVEV